jgi:phosphatidylinositol alpha-1,6-mannosyltransferase
VVSGRDLAQLVDRVARLLADRDLARQLGAAGRAWVEREWRWEAQAARMATLLAG